MAIEEHAAIENHTLDWDTAKKIEQVPACKMRGIKEVISIRSTLTTSTILRMKDISFLMCGTLSSHSAPLHPPATEDKEEWPGGGPVTYFLTRSPHSIEQ